MKNELEVKYITMENVEYYEGATLFFEKKAFHYYPLTIKNHSALGYCFVDRNKVIIPFDDKTALPYTTAEWL